MSRIKVCFRTFWTCMPPYFCKGIPQIRSSSTTLLPFVKSYKKSLRSPNNYRGISLIPILTKKRGIYHPLEVLERAVSHTSQFGFKTFSSTQPAGVLISDTRTIMDPMYTYVVLMLKSLQKPPSQSLRGNASL